MPKKKVPSKPKLYCERCHRTGHLTKDCYTRICDYCGKIGHHYTVCRTFDNDRQRVLDSAMQFWRTYFAKSVLGEYSQDVAVAGTSTSNIDTEMSSLSTVGAYREYLMSPNKDIIEITTPELKGGKAKMMISANCPITVIKIGKLKDTVAAAKEVLILEDAYGAQVKTICLICLSIHLNKKTVLHPCRVVPDDFYIETDGVLGNDFVIKAKVQPGKHVELAGIQIPFIDNEFIRGVRRVDELIDISQADSDSETLTESSNP